MADYYWVGSGATGTKNWNNSTYWASYSGGPGGAGVPNGASSNAIFDANSPADRVKINAASSTVINDFDSSAWTGTFYYDWTTINGFYLNGNIKTNVNVTWESGGTGTTTRTICALNCQGSGTQNITTNGATFNVYLTASGSGQVVLLDNWDSTSTTVLNNGTTLFVSGGYFSANGYNVSLTRVSATSGSLVLGNGSWTIRGSSAASNIFTASGLTTYSAGTSTVTFTGTSALINVSGTNNPSAYIFYNLVLAGTSSGGTYKIYGSSNLYINYYSLSVTTTAPYTLIFGSDKTNNYTHVFANNFSANGTAGNLITLQSSDGSYMLMNNNTGSTKTISYAKITNFYGAGGTWVGDYCNNLGSNANITFTNSVGGSFMPLLVT